jgi:hypothetical protein
LILTLAFPAAAPAAGTGPASVTPAQFLVHAAGVYKRRFQNGGFGGPEGQLVQYESEDILEVVPIDARAAYVRLDLAFFNGHTGRIYGIATYVAPASLVYDNGESGEKHCVLALEWTATAVTTHADYGKTPGCTAYHGVRGSLDHVELPTAQRREIRYMERLRNSREFKEAWAEYRRRTGPSR